MVSIDSSKTPIVLIHGMWSIPEALRELRYDFESKGYQVHVPRLPFHTIKSAHNSENKAKLARTSI